jgi:predicted nucleotidyltransferase
LRQSEEAISSVVPPALPSKLAHLTPPERAALSDFLARLREQYADEVVSVRLFGSRARGGGGPESDLDVLVVVRSEDWRVQWDIVRLASRTSLAHDVDLSSKVLSQRQYRWLGQRRSLFHQNVQTEGIQL